MTLLDYWQSVVLVDSGDFDAASPVLAAIQNADTDDPFIAAFPMQAVGDLCAAIIAARRGESAAAQGAFDAGAASLQPMLEELDTTWFEAAIVMGGAASFVAAPISLAGTAVFQDYLDAAAAAGGAGAVSWFQFNGDTYAVNDQGASAVYENGTDEVVKLTGLVDLSKATIADFS